MLDILHHYSSLIKAEYYAKLNIFTLLPANVYGLLYYTNSTVMKIVPLQNLGRPLALALYDDNVWVHDFLKVLYLHICFECM